MIFSALSSGGRRPRKLPGGRRREEAAPLLQERGETPEGSDPALFCSPDGGSIKSGGDAPKEVCNLFM